MAIQFDTVSNVVFNKFKDIHLSGNLSFFIFSIQSPKDGNKQKRRGDSVAPWSLTQSPRQEAHQENQ